ncbi:MAG: CPBP family intramembrane metalloprotease [Campylobacterales bacterium]|nr:CPBP family intramembrane metalloprotease [Campylobacterales bacterium]
MVILLYPLFSVLAQEIVFRAFFIHRFGQRAEPRTLIVVNALLFGNVVAVVFSFLGGLLFMSTYLKTRSVGASSIEHALYGDLVFTLGIGFFFYHGA